MYQADLNHPSPRLQTKLEALYSLSRGIALDLDFRPPYLDLLRAFGNPQDHLPPIIHVAGTNGKGSTIATLRAILQQAGYKVHAYTSPHLRRFNERIVLAGAEIGDRMLEGLVDEALEKNAGAQITFFEITTAIAFEAFRRVPADILLLEVGLGGKLDCTNIISKPCVSIISRISMDHTAFLGNTLEKITREKAGIIKYETPCIVGYQALDSDQSGQKAVVEQITDEAMHKNAPVFCAGAQWRCEPHQDHMIFTFDGQSLALPRPNLPGDHQIHNAGAALAALKVIERSFPLSPAQISKGLRTIHWPGRLENIHATQLGALLPAGWTLWYDGGHNDSAGAALARQIRHWHQEAPAIPIHIILGMKADKDPESYLRDILPLARTVSLVELNDIGACVTAGQIEPLCAGKPAVFLGQKPSLEAAISDILQTAHYGTGRIILCGSLYLAEKIQ